MIRTNIIECGDSIEKMHALPDESVDLIFADPPYWMRVEGKLQRVEGTDFDGCDDEWDQFHSLEDYEKFTRRWLEEAYRVLKKDGSFWVIGSMQCIYTIGAIMQDIGFWFVNDVVWHKKNPTPNFMGTRLNNSHETLIWATKSKKSRFCFNYKTAKELNHDNVSDEEYAKGKRKQLGSVWRIAVCQGSERLKDAEGKKLHSTQKPEELLYRVIAISSKTGDIVLDPFGGTFTTAAIAKRLGRSYISYDMDETYCEYGRKRIEQEKYVLNDISKAVFDEKPLRVKVEDMIRDGFLHAGEKFYMKDRECKNISLLTNGKLMFNGAEIDMHSCAARVREVKADRLNGFDYWMVEREGKMVSISDVREEYRRFIKEKFARTK